MDARSNSRTIRITRVYYASLDDVWDAWTIPAEIAQWWGPRGFTLTTHSRELRAGGHWHYTMHGPDGTDYENTTQYLEVVPRERLVYDHGGHRDRPPLFRVTATFSGKGNRTQLDLEMTLATPEAAHEMRGFIAKAGGNGTWDRLAEHLEKRRTGKECFVIARSFDADIAQVYAMWTDPAHLVNWMPPTGSTMRFLRTEPQAGGSSLFEMIDSAGNKLHGLLNYQQLEPPRRIVYTQQFCDAQGKVGRPPFFKDWPLTMQTVVELAPEDDGFTRVVVRWEPAADATAADIAEFVRQRGSMTQGWTGSFDKLELQLA